jgi:two-component system response regulator HydG
VRELENAIERACALSSGPVLHLGDMPTQLQDLKMHRAAEAAESLLAQAQQDAAAPHSSGAAGEIISIAELEKQAILNTIKQLNGDKLLAARLLGIGKTTLYRKLKEYGVVDLQGEQTD